MHASAIPQSKQLRDHPISRKENSRDPEVQASFQEYV